MPTPTTRTPKKKISKKQISKRPASKKAASKKPVGARTKKTSSSKSYFDIVRRIGLALPEVEESTSYGTPALKVKGKLMVRLREDGVTLVVVTEPGARDILMEARPKTYFITDHYAPYPQLMLVDLVSVPRDELRALVEDAWQNVAPARMRRR